jgi:FdhE protein
MRHYLRYLYWTPPGVWESEIRPRLDAAARQNPGWSPWITLLEATLREVAGPVWPVARLRLRPRRPAAAPLLVGAAVSLDLPAVRHWVRRFLKRLRQDAGGRPATRAAIRHLDALAFFEAALCLDEPLGAVAFLAAMPLLQACGQFCSGQFPAAWPYGYCPVCGLWPALAELCGLEGAQRLRCARCGAAWGTTWLGCPYCGERDHQRLGVLVPEGSGETRKVATCLSCKGYLKTLTTLQASPGYAIPLDDLATIDLDIASMERGYTRPQQLGYHLAVRVGERRGRWRFYFDWRS